jgi:predicted RNA-binding Zn ribbon-like protein
MDNLITWTRMVGVLNQRQIAELQKQTNTTDADRILKTVKKLRETVYSLFNKVITKEKILKSELDSISALSKKAFNHLELVPVGREFEWILADNTTALNQLQFAIAKSATEVLTGLDLSRIKKCPSCQWLYWDVSKNKSRRWCTMEDCGNRHKVNAFNKGKREKAVSRKLKRRK